MLSFGEFLKEVSAGFSAARMRGVGPGKRDAVIRVDHPDAHNKSPLNVKNLHTYATNTPQRRSLGDMNMTSGRIKPTESPGGGMTKTKGLFAGSSASEVAPYSIPRDKPWITSDHHKTLFVNKSDAPSIEKHKVQLSTFSRSKGRFSTLPTGEQFSTRPGSPLKSTTVRSGDLLRNTGYRVKQVPDLQKLADRARRRGINFGAEGLNELSKERVRQYLRDAKKWHEHGSPEVQTAKEFAPEWHGRRAMEHIARSKLRKGGGKAKIKATGK